MDDNATNRKVLQMLLEQWGMICESAELPGAALALLSTGKQFDVAILDMHMPEMDGQELALAIRQLPSAAGLPLLLLSSVARRPGTKDAEVFSSMMTKPVRSKVLLEKLLFALARPSPRCATSSCPAAPGGTTRRRCPARR